MTTSKRNTHRTKRTSATKRTNKPKRDVYADVTNAIVTMIEDGLNGSWQRPWANAGSTGGMPTSIAGRAYRGINTLLLLGKAHRAGYSSNLWGTYRAWQTAGAQVRGGQKGTLVVFWKRITVTDTNDDGTKSERPILFAKGFTVFAAEQVDGFDLDAHNAAQHAKLPAMAERLASVEQTVAAYRSAHDITLAHGGDRAYYSPSADHVQMPPLEAFRETEGYYSTLLHEAGHSTGHSSRLDRDFSGRFGSDAYAFEELVAELTSAMLCGTLGVSDSPREDHAKYVQSWLKVLKGDKRAIFTAASKAQAAADLIVEHADAETQADHEHEQLAA